MKYNQEMEMITKAVKEAYLAHGSFDSVSDKARFDLVTDADVNIEKFIIARIREQFPEDRIQSEETGFDTKIEGRTWTIDPIDGTNNMAKGLPLFAVQCAMFQDQKPVLAVIWFPVLQQLYTAQEGEGAYCNGSRITVKPSDPQRAVVSFGDFSHARPDDFTDEHRMLYLLSMKIARIRMFGTAAMDFAALASGQTDGTVLFTKNQWDLAPGTLIAREAGAVVVDLDGNDYSIESRAIVAGASREIADLIRESF